MSEVDHVAILAQMKAMRNIIDHYLQLRASDKETRYMVRDFREIVEELERLVGCKN